MLLVPCDAQSDVARRSRTRLGPAPKGGRAWTTVRCVIAALLLLTTFPALSTTAHADEVVVSLEFDPAQLTFEQHEAYDLVSLDGAVYTTETAYPMLPAVHSRVLLPEGARVIGVETTSGGTVHLPGHYRILPAPRPVRFSSVEAASIPQPNAETYNSVLPYPREAARLAGVGSLSGYSIATLVVTPLQYVPVTGRLVLHTEVRIVLTLAPTSRDGAAPALGAPAVVTDLVRTTVANADAINTYVGAARADRDEAIDYIVICPESLAGEFVALTEWKTRKGVRAEIVTLKSILSNPLFSGADAAESIRRCIRHYRGSHGLTWVLLGGDTDVVPTRNAHDFFYEQGIPCDLYYADLDGTWDDDDDGLYGEIGEDDVDMYADVFVGRAPVRTQEEAATFVRKVLEYEGANSEVAYGYQLDMLFLGEILWDSPDPYTDGGVALDMIDDAYVPDRFDAITKLYERDGSLDLTSCLTELEKGYGIVMHEGHSGAGALSVGPDNLASSVLDALENGDRAGVWYSVGCWSAAIDRDAFGEHWLANPGGGGVAYIGNTRYGWGCPGYPGQCVSDLYSQRFFDALLTRGLSHAGLVHAAAKHHFVGAARSDEYMRYAMYELTLLGDPEMPVWTDLPAPLSVSHPETVAVRWGVSDVEVRVGSDRPGLAGARVCLMSEDGGIYEVRETGINGSASFRLSVDDTTVVAITVTAPDHVPYRGSVTLAPSHGGEGADGEHTVRAALMQNHPNPFGPTTDIAYVISERKDVHIAVYDARGRRVAVLLDREVTPGTHSVTWSGQDELGAHVGSGTYFVRMTIGSLCFDRKIVLLR